MKNAMFKVRFFDRWMNPERRNRYAHVDVTTKLKAGKTLYKLHEVTHDLYKDQGRDNFITISRVDAHPFVVERDSQRPISYDFPKLPAAVKQTLKSAKVYAKAPERVRPNVTYDAGKRAGADKLMPMNAATDTSEARIRSTRVHIEVRVEFDAPLPVDIALRLRYKYKIGTRRVLPRADDGTTLPVAAPERPAQSVVLESTADYKALDFKEQTPRELFQTYAFESDEYDKAWSLTELVETKDGKYKGVLKIDANVPPKLDDSWSNVEYENVKVMFNDDGSEMRIELDAFISSFKEVRKVKLPPALKKQIALKKKENARPPAVAELVPPPVPPPGATAALTAAPTVAGA